MHGGTVHRRLARRAARVSCSRRSARSDDGHEALRTGKYQEAITLLSKVPATRQRLDRTRSAI